ncbi:hypothetical protein ACWZEH_01190 [Streptomyces sp. QTS137]
MSATTTPSTPTPTAPGGLPLIGHAHRLARDPLPFITSLRRHGSVVRIRIGPSPAYVVTDPALTRRVLVTDAAHFVKGGRIIDALRVFFGDGLATIADGDVHLRNRRPMRPICHRSADPAPLHRHLTRPERPGGGHRQAGQADHDVLVRDVRASRTCRAGGRRGQRPGRCEAEVLRVQPAYTLPSFTT